MAQFDALLAILEPHIKKKTTNFCELSVQGSIYNALCCETKWMNLTIATLDFGVRLYGGSELSKHLSKCLLQMRKTQKIEPDPKKIMTDESFGGSVIDTTWGRNYFSTCENFGLCVQWPLQWRTSVICCSNMLKPLRAQFFKDLEVFQRYRSFSLDKF